jgi:hypothetical protein
MRGRDSRGFAALSRSGIGRALVLGLLLGATLLWAPSAEAQTQTSGAILLAPDCCQNSPVDVGTPNKTVHIAIAIQSTSQIFGSFVDATITGTTTIILGCTTGATSLVCSGTELAALTFDSCAPAGGVSACVQDGGNPNHVLITYPPGGKAVSTAAGGTLVAVITAHFTPFQEILVPASGRFFILGNTGDGALSTPAALGSAGGSGPSFYPGFCGDGIVNPAAGETCDPNDPATAPGCRTSGPDACTKCGDGVVQPTSGETCDGTAGAVGTGCRTDCTSCGDGVLQAGDGETCDGTAGAVGTGCRTDCTSCGDGVLQAGHGETCDGAAGAVGTGCRTTGPNACTSCGDGVLQASAGETCDPPGAVAGGNGQTCRTDCTVCGDGVIQASDGEVCDDGSPTATCNNVCQVVLGITTVPNPDHGIIGTVLNDTATVSGNVPAGATVTFQLFAPSNPTCDPNQQIAFQQQSVPVVNGNAATTGGFAANEAGTWRWTVFLDQDPENVISRCTEPVTIRPPTIPTLSEWGMLLLVGLLVGGGLLALRRRRNLTT